MPKHAADSSRRATRPNVVIGIAVLAAAAVVLVTGVTSRDSVSAARPHTAATPSSGLTTASPANESPATTALIALPEASAQPLQPTIAAQSTEPPAVPVVAPLTAEPVPAPAPVEEAPAAVAPTVAPAAPAAEALITGRMMYATEPVNVRSAPDKHGTSVLVSLDSREQVTAGDSVDGWVPVHAGDVYGWVKSGYLAEGTAPAPAPAAARAARAPAAAPTRAAPTKAAPTEAAPAAESAGNWMEALIPRVDPNGVANWVFSRNGGWGASDGHTNYIDPGVPSNKRYSVMVHEYSHVLQAQVYGSLSKSIAAMSALTGASPSDASANEKTADCMALLLGASWINYGCPDSLRGAASAIVAGRRA